MDFSTNIFFGLSLDLSLLKEFFGSMPSLGRYGLMVSSFRDAYGNLLFKSSFFTVSKLLLLRLVRIFCGWVFSLFDISYTRRLISCFLLTPKSGNLDSISRNCIWKLSLI